MSNKNPFSSVVEEMMASWPIIAVAVLLGAALGAGLGWLTQPEPGHTATVTIRYVAPSGVPGAPTADTFVAMALNPSVQATAAAYAGVDAGEYDGVVDAGVDSRDPSLVSIRVTSPDEQLAASLAEALTEAARLEALRPAERYAELYRNRIGNNQETIRVVEMRIAELQEQLAAAGLSSADRIALQGALHNEEIRLMSSVESLESNRFTLATYSTTADLLGQTATEPESSIEHLISGALRGAAIGLFVGMLVAGVSSRRSRSDETSS